MKYSYELYFEKETPGTVRYTAEIDGRKETLYVPKSRLDGTIPQTIVVTVADATSGS
jgi:hypothetical protein